VSFESELEETVPGLMRELVCPGAAVALIRGGRPAFTRVFGFADRERGAAAGPETLFSLQSISKSFMAVCILMLVEEGRIDLDAPADDYLRSWRIPHGAFPREMVTVRRLLAHHAGVSQGGFLGSPPDLTPPGLRASLDGEVNPMTPEQDAYWNEWTLSREWGVRIEYPPGEGWKYSNGGYGILQMILEDLSGQNLSAFLRERIFAPLGLSRATLDPHGDANCASPYGPEGKRRAHYRIPCGAAGGVYATIGELAEFACSLIRGPSGGGLIGASSAREMFTPHGLADRNGELQFETGLGCLLLNTGGGQNVHHSGGSIGWRSIYSIFPETGEGICMLMNSDQANPLWVPIVRKWREMVAQ